MKHKKLFISFTAILTVLLAISIFLVIWFWGDSYKSSAKYDGFETFRAEAEIPGLKDGACPQGLASYRAPYSLVAPEGENTDKTQLYFFMSAYFDNAPSRIYVIGKDTGYVGYVTMETPEGEAYYGHCGGVATNGYTFWMVSGRSVYCAQKSGTSSDTDNIARDIIGLAKENGSLRFTASFNANLNAAFCYFYDANPGDSRSTSDKLYVGEFYRGGNYETAERHHLTTKNGYENRAFVYEYSISTSSSNKFGLSLISSDRVADVNYVPKIQNVYSITDEIQGFARLSSGGLVLSQSYGLKNSHLLYYDWSKLTDSDNRVLYRNLEYVVKDKDGNPVLNEDGTEQKQTYGGFEYEGVLTTGGATYRDTGTVYVYYVDGGSILNDYSIPSMSEGLCVDNDRVYVLFESGAKKYYLFVRQMLDDIYSFIPRTKK